MSILSLYINLSRVQVKILSGQRHPRLPELIVVRARRDGMSCYSWPVPFGVQAHHQRMANLEVPDPDFPGATLQLVAEARPLGVGLLQSGQRLVCFSSHTQPMADPPSFFH